VNHTQPHDHDHDTIHHHETQPPLRILAIDVGAGTQDVLIYESDKTPENCYKLVLPSQTQIVARRIRDATAEGRPIHLTGSLMGGGASGYAVQAHLAAGLAVTATPIAAQTIHNDLDRVEALGVVITDDPPTGAVEVQLKDIDLDALSTALRAFEVDVPEVIAVAVQDHGDPLAGAGRVSAGRSSTAPQSPPTSTSVRDGAISVHNAVSLDTASGAERWRFATGDAVNYSPAVVDGVVYVGSDDHNVYALGIPNPEVTATVHAEGALDDAWDQYFTQFGAALSTSDRLPAGFAVAPQANPTTQVWSPSGWSRGASYPVDISAAKGDVSAIDALVLGSTKVAEAATTQVVDALRRAGWQQHNVKCINHDHTCLTLQQGGQSQAVCYVLRDDVVIVTSSALPLDAPEAVLTNAADLASFASGVYDEVARPAEI
jgi:hypothetical protein